MPLRRVTPWVDRPYGLRNARSAREDFSNGWSTHTDERIRDPHGVLPVRDPGMHPRPLGKKHCIRFGRIRQID